MVLVEALVEPEIVNTKAVRNCLLIAQVLYVVSEAISLWLVTDTIL